MQSIDSKIIELITSESMNRVKKRLDTLVEEKYVIRLMGIHDVWRVNISILCLRLLEIAIPSQTAVVARWIVTSG